MPFKHFMLHIHSNRMCMSAFIHNILIKHMQEYSNSSGLCNQKVLTSPNIGGFKLSVKREKKNALILNHKPGYPTRVLRRQYY